MSRLDEGDGQGEEEVTGENEEKENSSCSTKIEKTKQLIQDCSGSGYGLCQLQHKCNSSSWFVELQSVHSNGSYESDHT